jgi:hypothetical protein
MRLSPAALRRALWAPALVLAGASAAAAEETATLAAINPPAMIKNLKIMTTALALDGSDFGHCGEGRSVKDGVCITPRAIAPGPHVLEIVFSPFSSTYFRGTVKFTAGMRGDFVLDLAKLATGDGESTYLQLHGALAPVEGCIPAIEGVAGLSSCSGEGLGAVAAAFLDAARACSTGDVDHDALERALAAALAVHFKLDIHRCYDGAELKRLPGIITASAFPEDDLPWPPGTIDKASWYWARDVLAEETPGHSPIDVFDAVLQALPRLAERQAMLDGIIAAYVSRDPQGVLAAAAAAPWSHDPDRTDGQRNLLVLMDPRFFYDIDFADTLAARVAADRSLDCSTTRWEARHLLAYLTAEDSLSRAGWQAVAAMMARVPPDGDFTPCAPGFDARRRSPIPVAERLHRLVELDCAPGRSERGYWLKEIVRKDGDRLSLVDFDLRDRLRAEFAACLDGK